jgi:hypothetical protein
MGFDDVLMNRSVSTEDDRGLTSYINSQVHCGLQCAFCSMGTLVQVDLEDLEDSQIVVETQGLVPITKGKFFLFFWAAWINTITEKLILRSFEATGIFPMDRKAVLKRFRSKTPRTPEEDDVHERQSSPLVEANWRTIRHVIEQVVKDGEQRKAQQISESFHHLQVTNELLREKNNGLQNALKLKQKHRKKGKVLDLQQREEYHDGAVFWSPRKLKEAKYCEDVRLQEE